MRRQVAALAAEATHAARAEWEPRCEAAAAAGGKAAAQRLGPALAEAHRLSLSLSERALAFQERLDEETQVLPPPKGSARDAGTLPFATMG